MRTIGEKENIGRRNELKDVDARDIFNKDIDTEQAMNIIMSIMEVVNMMLKNYDLEICLMNRDPIGFTILPIKNKEEMS